MKKLALFASVLMLGALTAGAGTLGVAAFNDGAGTTDINLTPSSLQATFMTLKNNTGSPQEYTILYYSLQGVDRTPAANTFTIAGNAARSWRPVATDANEGAGSTIPNATGTAGAGTASILYTDSPAPSGVVRIFVGNQSSYSWSMIP
ncbi:MAG: hypothetical protein HUU46_20330 [Candidatus Hydrogenedentes bacterium]|nr:hypothetical protein [Candidatus Hydrogenedentota bacterium]